ncbi:glycosyltransferase family protein [Alkalibacillus haloalkaliphilus]|uniref:Spore coat polysaccharide biosynthesis protein SpsB n=1 Tax=Alkalibacillus haloalkaliphilus TaxID=94136 RepID=A0A511W357_9BACI|nr:hypothetical protein [Alkalibacillus haloalkaliphilus]GEN45514.1 spore coat polysaccharide biosynthesis protein SpsB [Alkalibacillus haloalkaliphilus]
MDKQLYEQHYWSLYTDFLDMFQTVKYKGYDLAYLCHFRSLIKKNESLFNRLGNPNLTNNLNHTEQSGLDIQEKFNEFLLNDPIKERKSKSNGPVAYHDVYHLLRLPQEQFHRMNSILLLEKSNRKRTISDRTIPIHYIQDYLNEPNLEHSIQKVNKTTKKIMKSNQHHPLIHPAFKQRLLEQFEIIIKRINEAEDFFQKVKPSCLVVASTHYPQTRTLIVVARKYGIPTICMQHGIISSEFGYIPKIAQVDAVYGEFEKKWFQSKSVDPDGLEIVGHPRFDLLEKGAAMSKRNFNRKLKLSPRKKTILIVVRGNNEITEWRQFIKRLNRLGNYNLILRDFPNNGNHPLLQEFSNLNSTKGVPLYDAIHHADAVVSYSSTVALESMLANKQVYIFNRPFPGYVGYFDELGDLVHASSKTLARAVHQYLNKTIKVNKKQVQFLKQAYPNKNKPSGFRLIKLIERLTDGKGR